MADKQITEVQKTATAEEQAIIDKAKEEAEKAAAEAKKIAKKEGEEEAQKWLDQKLQGISAEVEAKVSGVKSWMAEELNKAQTKIFEETRKMLAEKSSTPPASTTTEAPATPSAESRGSQSATSAAESHERTRKRRRI